MSLSIDNLALDAHLSAPRWLIAYSGGVDSHVLLHLLARYRNQSSRSVPELLAIHINHQLQEPSQAWAEHCQQVCQQLEVPLYIEAAKIDRSGGESLEAKARDARYAIFQQQMQAGDVLFLAHHLDDQLETWFLRLLRGSGVQGMGAMDRQRDFAQGLLLRPLLETPRQAIVDFALSADLQWVEDPSNQDSGFSRNFLRGEVLPLLEQRWPEYRQNIARAVAHSQEASTLNRSLAELDCQRLQFDPRDSELGLGSLLSLEPVRQKNVLRYWMECRGLPVPTAAQLQAVLGEVVGAARDADPVVHWAGIEARRFGSSLFIQPCLPHFDGRQSFPWLPEQTLELDGNGVLCSTRVTGKGLLAGGDFLVRFRQGGERCQPFGRSASQTLKKLFQEYQVPTWLRDRVPLVYDGDQLVAAANYWVCEGHVAGPGEQGLDLCWTPP